MKKDMQAWRGWVWPLGFAATIVVESSQSGVGVPGGIWQADKIVHFLVFGLLATVTLRALRIESPRSRAVLGNTHTGHWGKRSWNNRDTTSSKGKSSTRAIS